MILLIAATVLAAVFAFVVGIAGSRRKEILAERLGQYRSERETVVLDAEGRPHLRQQRSYSGLPLFSAFLAQFKGSEQAALSLERAGIPLRVGEYYLIRYSAAVLLFAVPFVFSRSLIALMLGLGLAVVGYMLPPMYVSSKRKGRTAKINIQMVEMLGMVSNSLKSGYGLMQSFEFAARQMPPPLSMELRRMLREANLGLSAEDALNLLGERIDSPDLDMVITAINIQRAVGGNLSEILEKVAYTMRDRERIRGEIQTLTAQQRMTGIVIGGLPVGMGVLFMMINPAYMGLLFTETVGQIMLVLAVGLEVVGAFSMKRILAIDV